MTADIHNFLSPMPVLTKRGVEYIETPAPRKPLSWAQRDWIDKTYGPRREHPPCLPQTVTPPIETLCDNLSATVSAFNAEWYPS